MKLRSAVLALTLLGTACAADYQLPGPSVMPPRLEGSDWIAADGAHLPMRAWLPQQPPKAVILALHGMNDYSNFFDEPGKYLAELGIASYAYDQRGFGAAPRPGIWSSTQAMTGDLRQATALVAARHPGVPLYLLGESMGGAVVMVTVAGDPPPGVRGIILSAPAVWGRSSMGWFPQMLLWVSYQVAPGWTLTGEGLDVLPSDNIEMLRKLAADPLVVKGTRVDAIHGLVDLMDDAATTPAAIEMPALVLYGDHDEVVPADPSLSAMAALPHLGSSQRAALYPQGYHMLLRDLHAKVVLDDIVAWIDRPAAALPSGADERARQALKKRSEE